VQLGVCGRMQQEAFLPTNFYRPWNSLHPYLAVSCPAFVASRKSPPIKQSWLLSKLTDYLAVGCFVFVLLAVIYYQHHTPTIILLFIQVLTQGKQQQQSHRQWICSLYPHVAPAPLMTATSALFRASLLLPRVVFKIK